MSVTDDKLADLRQRMSKLADDLVRLLAPLEAVGALMGPAIGILDGAYGGETAAEHLRDLAGGIERGDDLPPLTVGYA